MTPVLFDFFRSTAAWRVRIALALKGVEFDHHGVWIRGEEHKGEAYRAANPQGLVPALKVDGTVIPQSIAILEWLEATYPDPAILPSDEVRKAIVRSGALLIACDIHPLNNRRVLEHLKHEFGLAPEAIHAWERHWIEEGFRGLQEQVQQHSDGSRFLFGDTVSMADICLVPQIANALRAGVDIEAYPMLARVNAEMERLPAVQAAHPDRQPDAAKQ